MAVGLSICQVLHKEHGIKLDRNAQLVGDGDGRPHPAVADATEPNYTFHESSNGDWSWWAEGKEELDPHFTSVSDFRYKLPSLQYPAVPLNAGHVALVHLEADDVPPGSVVKDKKRKYGWQSIAEVALIGIDLIDDRSCYVSFDRLMKDGWLIKRP